MITCKEDLQNTYVKNDNGELANCYISASKRFGFSQLIVNKESASYFVCGDETIGGRTTSDCFDNLKQLKLSDFKPQKPTRTEYVKVTESIFDLKEEFEKGRLFHNECVIRSATALAECYTKDNIYRRIEKEVDWRDEVITTAPAGYGISKSGEFNGQLVIDGIYSKEQAIALAESIITATA